MHHIKERCDPPVPQISAHEVSQINLVGVAFIIMELLPGNVAMDSCGGFKVHHSVMTRQHRQTFHRCVAEHHVCSPFRLIG